MQFTFAARAALAAAALVLAASAGAQQPRTAADSLGPHTELEFCATYLPCRIAVGIMEGTADAQSRLQRIRAFFAGIGQRPSANESEWQALVASQTPDWRKGRVHTCLSSNTQEVCEGIFLTPAEAAAAKEARKPPEPVRMRMTEHEARRMRSDVLDEENGHYNGLWVNCKDERADTQQCEDSIAIFARVKDKADALNANPEFRNFLPAIELRMEALARQTHDYDGRRWFRKPEAARASNQKFNDCERLRRETSAAIDARRFDEGRSMAQRLRDECGKVHADFSRMGDFFLQRVAKEAAPDPLAALPRRNAGGEGAGGSDLVAQALGRAQRGEALDDRTLPGRGGMAAAGGGGSGGGGAELLAGVFQAVAQTPGMASNPIMAGMLQGMRANNPEMAPPPPVATTSAARATTAPAGSTTSSGPVVPAETLPASDVQRAFKAETACSVVFDKASELMQDDIDDVQFGRVQTRVAMPTHLVALYSWRQNILDAHPSCAKDAATVQRGRRNLAEAQETCSRSRGAACTTGSFGNRSGSQLLATLSQEVAKGGTAASSAGSSDACEAEANRATADFEATVARLSNSGSMAMFAATSAAMTRLSTIWQPCNARLARNFADRAAQAMKSCIQLATHEGACRR